MTSLRKTCIQCGEQFLPSRRTAKFCSQKCRIAAWVARQPKPEPKEFSRDCEWCGEQFTYTKNRKRRFCGSDCNHAAQNKARTTTQLEWRVCPVCDERFQPKQNRGTGRTYCSDACRSKRRYRRNGGGLNKTFVDYDALYRKQNGRCAICGEKEATKAKGRRKRLAVDHCHTNGHIRGLLCMGCNTGLGSFKDDPARIRTAIEYLTRR